MDNPACGGRLTLGYGRYLEAKKAKLGGSLKA